MALKKAFCLVFGVAALSACIPPIPISVPAPPAPTTTTTTVPAGPANPCEGWPVCEPLAVNCPCRHLPPGAASWICEECPPEPANPEPQCSDAVACDCWWQEPVPPSTAEETVATIAIYRWAFRACAAPTPEPTPSPTPAPTPVPEEPMNGGGDCGQIMPAAPVPVVGGHLQGQPVVRHAGMTVAASSCPSPEPRENGRCFPMDLAEGVTLPERETECRGMAHWILQQEPVRGMACFAGNAQGKGSYKGGDREEKKRGCWDAYGRRVLERSFGSGEWVLAAHTGGGVVLAPPERSWSFHALCPPLVTRACPPEWEPTPEPIATPTPEPVEDPSDCVSRVTRIGLEWGLRPTGDQCQLPRPNESADFPAGKNCQVYLDASPRAGNLPTSPHVGDDPACFLAVRPTWYQDPTCGSRDDCVDIRLSNPESQGSTTWVLEDDGTPAYRIRFQSNAPSRTWVQACLGAACSARLEVRHR